MAIDVTWVTALVTNGHTEIYASVQTIIYVIMVQVYQLEMNKSYYNKQKLSPS